jgi:hypothetical protein
MAFVEPLALLFTGLYGVLVLFYLWERWRQRVVVPSLLLWQSVQEDIIRARRFRPDLLFLLQLLVLTFLILGLAKPYLRGAVDAAAGGRRILVLDTTASMQAREGRATRFDAAREAALARLASFGAADEVMLITAGHTPEVSLGFTRDRTAVAEAIDRIAPTDTGGDLGVALAYAAAARRRSDAPAVVEVFTDMPRSQLPQPWRDEVTVHQVGESDDNVGIQALQIFQGRFQDFRQARAQVLVRNYSHREGHGFLNVQVDEQVVTRMGFTIPPRESKGFLVGNFPQPGIVVARLETADALAADNVAYGWLRPTVPVRLLLVSATLPLAKDLRALAAASDAIQLFLVAPANLTDTELARADIVVFNRVVPPAEPSASVLYIYPEADTALCRVVGEATNVEVLDWNARHPALAAIRPLAAQPLQQTRIVSAPAWAQGLLWSRTEEREFPLALAGERDGRRTACITFDLEAERLLSSDNVNFLLFFMNLLGWLSPERSEAVVANTGEVRSLGPFPERPVRMRDPRGTEYSFDEREPAIEPLYAGIHQLRSDGTRQVLLANFIDPVESDIGRGGKEPPAPGVPDASGTVTGTSVSLPQHPYGAWLYALALALFALEWGVARREPS